jgi:hypothetical protein
MGYKLLHETGARRHYKLLALRRRGGYAAFGRFWALSEIIAEAENAELFMSELVQDMLSAELELGPGELNSFLQLCEDCQLIDRRENTLTIHRIKENRAAYLAKCERLRENAAKGGAAKARGRDDGAAVAAWWKDLLTAEKPTLDDVEALAAKHNVAEEERERFRELSRVHGKKNVGHAVLVASAHLQANGDGKEDFISYVETWLLREAKAAALQTKVTALVGR